MALPLTYIANVTVNLAAPGITRQGFGTAMLLSNTGNAWGTPELTRDYTSLAGVLADFATATPEYQAAAGYFGQPNKPAMLVIGKGTNKPTEIKDLAISAVTAGATYKVNVYQQGALQSVAYTAAASVAWAITTTYNVGDVVTHDTNKLYVCIAQGTSAGAGGPTGTTLNITDGSVTWNYVGAGGAGVTSNDAIVFALLTLINALAAPAPNFTAAASGSAGSRIIACTSNAAGNWFAIEPIASTDPTAVSNLMALTDATTDPGVATDLAAILLADSTWYGLILLFKSTAILSTQNTGAAVWCDNNGRLLICAVSDTASATTAFPGSDVLDVLTDAGYTHTGPQWHPRDYEWLDACTYGYFFPQDPGSYVVRLKTLVGPTPVTFTSTQAGTSTSNLDKRRAGYYTTIGNDAVLAGGGYVESTTYGFLDVTIGIDWYVANLQADFADLFIAAVKIPNTEAGRRQIAGVIQKRNDAGIAQGVISGDPLNPPAVNVPYVVTVPPVTDTAHYNAATRTLSGITTQWKLAGAINAVNIAAYVTQ